MEKVEDKKPPKQRVRQIHVSKSDEPDLQESAFCKKIIVYQRKLLVRPQKATTPIEKTLMMCKIKCELKQNEII